MRVSVVIPTYRRPNDLGRACRAMASQTRQADQVVIVTRVDDQTSRDLVERFHPGFPIDIATVNEPGVVAALNVGLTLAAGDVVAFTDDDAAPASDWLERIERHFATDPALWGVGGRDVIHDNLPHGPPIPGPVGKLQWWGRVTGNHHVGSGPARPVHVLKGVNMSFRRDALTKVGFDTRMRGPGAQVHFELSLCLSLVRRGGKLIYDPELVVDHYPAPRHDPDHRGAFALQPHLDAVHNQTLALLEHFHGPRRAVFLIWAVLVGTRVEPGLAQLPRLFFRREPQVLTRWRATRAGRRAAEQTFRT